MKAVTLRQPWPYAVCYLGKDIENRTWTPVTLKVGDYLAIHGGKKPSGFALEEAVLDMQYICELVGISGFPENWALEGIVAVAQFGGIARDSSSDWAARGQFHWKLMQVRAFETPIPCKGSQGLWDLPEDVLKQVRLAYGELRERAA